MRIILSDFYSSTRLTTSASIEELTETSENAAHLCGIYAELGSNIVGLFVLRKTLYFLLNGFATQIREKNVTVSHHVMGSSRDLQISVRGKVYIVSYEDPGPPVSTPFYSETESDADFGLRLSHILQSEERQNSFIEAWTQSAHSG